MPSDPPAPAGDLRAEIDRFTTLEACVTEHAKTDPLVGDALRAIGYDTFLRDACRVLQAMKEKKTDACKPIDAQGLRDKCEASVAIQEGKPEICPWAVAGAQNNGRDPRCVAVASRDPRLCAGATHADRAPCAALIAHSEQLCAGDATCARDVARWQHVFPGPGTGKSAPLTTRASLEIHGAEGTADPSDTKTDLAIDFGRGVVVVQDFAGTHVELGAPREVGTTVFAPSPSARARLALAIVVGEKGTSIEHAEVGVPGGATLVIPGARWDDTVKVDKLEAQRAGEIALTLDGTIGASPKVYKVHAEIATFVRDVVTSPTAAVPKDRR